VRGDATGDGNLGVLGQFAALEFRGVNLFWNGKMPLASSDLSLALRCSMSEFVSSIKMVADIKAQNPG